MEQFEDVPSQRVRMGHLLESSTTLKAMVDNVLHDIDDQFQFKQVFEYPDNFDEWQRHHQSILKLTRCTLDMTQEDEKELLLVDNGDWTIKERIHWHKYGVCQCGGSNAAKQKMRTSALKSMGSGSGLPLLYRWKGFERSGAWCHINRSIHNQLDHALRRVFTKKNCDDAEEEARAAEARGDVVDHAVGHKVRAARVLKFFDRDPAATLTARAMILQQPGHSYLNSALKSQKEVTKYVSMLQETPLASIDEASRTEQQACAHALVSEQEAKARRMNVVFLSAVSTQKCCTLALAFCTSLWVTKMRLCGVVCP